MIFQEKMFLVYHSINWPNFIDWLPLLLEIFSNMCITVVSWPGYDVIKFKINLMFLIKPFWYMTKRSRQKLKYVENGMSFWGEIKTFFIIFKAASAAKNYLRPESAPLKIHQRSITESFLLKSCCSTLRLCRCSFIQLKNK